MTSENSCLMNIKTKRKNMHHTNPNSPPIPVLQQCRIRYRSNNSLTNISTTEVQAAEVEGYSENLCMHRSCIEDHLFDFVFLGNIYPIYNTPCRSNKLCFRGHCLEKGVVVRNLATDQCLLSSDYFVSDDKLIVSTCPVHPTRLQEFVLEEKQVGTYLLMRYTASKECLAVDTAVNSLKFESCSSTVESVTLGWDLIVMSSHIDEFLLCHRSSKQCAVAERQFSYVKLTSFAEISKNHTWYFDKTTTTTNAFQKHARKFEDVIKHYGLDLEISTSLYCDQECALHFSNNSQSLRDYWNAVIQDANTKFRSIGDINIVFKVSDATFLNESENQAIHARDAASFINVHANFMRWIYQKQQNMQGNNIPVLLTALTTAFTRSIFHPGSVCKYNHRSKMYLGSVVLGIGSSDLEWCDEVVKSFTTILSTDSFPSESCNQSVQLLCKDRSHFLSECTIGRIRSFLTSKDASCLFNINIKSYQTSLTPKSPPVAINMSTQCKLLTKNKYASTKAAEENCQMTKCYSIATSTTKVIGSIYPLTRTPCGTHKHCVAGTGLLKGHLVESVTTGECLLPSDYLSLSSSIQVFTCSKRLTPFDELLFEMIDDNSDLVAIPFINSPNKTITKRCLMAGMNDKVPMFEKCPDNDTTYFQWKKIKARNSERNFLLLHKRSNKCLKLAPDSTLYLGQSCSNHELSAQWRYFLPVDMKQAKGSNNTVTASSAGIGIKLFSVIVAIMIVLILFSWLAFIIWRKRHMKIEQQKFYLGNKSGINSGISVTDRADYLSFDSKWEFSITNLSFGKELGFGAFGRVLIANARGIKSEEPETTVAVKTLQTGAEPEHFTALKRELKILSHLGYHTNLVNLLGADKSCIACKKLYVVLEFCKYGNIRNYLLANRDAFVDQMCLFCENLKLVVTPKATPVNGEEHCDSLPDKLKDEQNKTACGASFESGYDGNYTNNETIQINTSDLIFWALQVAKGMNYLTYKRVLHGDLAARNILLTENNVVKICDFGFSKELRKNYDYSYKKDLKHKLMPYKWMAIESIEFGLFSVETDCWAYGMVLWELFSLGKTPYPGIAISDNFCQKLREGYRMEKPVYAPSKIYDVMMQCWAAEARERPSFSKLVELLSHMLGDEYIEEYTEVGGNIGDEDTQTNPS